MKMFLTRLGEGSRMVITGMFLKLIFLAVFHRVCRRLKLLKDIPDISFSYFTAKDVVRHKLVAAIMRLMMKNPI